MTFSSFNSSYRAPSAHKGLFIALIFGWYSTQRCTPTDLLFSADNDARLTFYFRHMLDSKWNVLNRFIAQLPCADLPESSSQIAFNVEEKQEFAVLLLVVRDSIKSHSRVASRCAVLEGSLGSASVFVCSIEMILDCTTRIFFNLYFHD